MQGSPLPEADEWAMPERRARDVMRDVPPPKRAPVDDDFRFPTPRGVLSKAEIEALLRPDLPTINDTDAPDDEPSTPVEKKFEPVDAVAQEEGRRIAARLSLLFAQSTGLKAAFRFQKAVHQHDLQSALGEEVGEPSTSFICFGLGGDEVTHVLEVPGALGNALISHACGGRSDISGERSERALSAIDCALIEQLLSPLRAAFGAEASFIGVETDQRFVGSLVPGQAGQQLHFEVALNERTVNLRLSQTSQQDRPEPKAEGSPDVRKRAVSALLTARLASLSVPVSQLTNLKPGDTLLLGLPADQPVQLLSGGRDGVKAFEGDIGRKGNNMAIRIRRSFNQ